MKRWVFIGLGACFVVLALVFYASGYADPQALFAVAAHCVDWCETQPVLAALLATAATFVWSLLLPTTPPILLLGYCFGLWYGAALCYVATTLAYLVAYAIGARLGRRGLERWLGARPRWQRWVARVQAGGWPFVVLMRLAPVMPFHIQNYCYGALHMGWWRCLTATLLGKAPNVVLTVAVGDAARRGVVEQGQSWWHLVVLVVMLLLLALLVQRWRRALVPDDNEAND